MKDKRYTAKEVINILEEQMDYDEYQKGFYQNILIKRNK